MAQDKAVDNSLGDLALFIVKLCEGFKLELPVVSGFPLASFKDECVCCDIERDSDFTQGRERGLCLSTLIALYLC